MRFIKAWTEFLKPGGGSVWRPTLGVYIEGIDGFKVHDFIVDSGADLSMAPYALFRRLGRKWEEGQRRVLRGISRRKVCAIEERVHEIDILIVEVGLRFTIPMVFAKAEVPFLLGREGFFDYFVVTFDKPARKTIFDFVEKWGLS